MTEWDEQWMQREIAKTQAQHPEGPLAAMLERARQDGRFEMLLELAAAAMENEVCRNCGARTIKTPF